MCIKENFPFEERDFSTDHCFVCGALLNAENKSVEHIYPKWLQKKFNLSSQKITLLNQSKIFYRNLTIPCCKQCNNHMSDRIEKPMERAVSEGYSSVISLDKNIIFQWLNKLSYGLLYKEAMLLVDRKRHDKGYIISSTFLQALTMRYVFLKSIIDDTEFIESPFSLLIFRLKLSDKISYWASDSIFTSSFCMFLGKVGIVANLQDNKFNERFFRESKKMCPLLDEELHYLQFIEVCAKFTYKSSLLRGTPNYFLVAKEGKSEQILSQTMSNFYYDDWSQKDYAQLFAVYLENFGYKFDDIYIDDKQVSTFLWDEHQNFIDDVEKPS